MAKQQPLQLASLVTVQDILAWYEANPWPLRPIDAIMPLEQTNQDTWKTVSNYSTELNEAADPISSKSKVPNAGRDGYKVIIGGMDEFGKGREMDADGIEKYDDLKQRFATTKNPADALALVDYYGGDLAFVRRAMQAQRVYLSYALLSAACSYTLASTNSPYFQGLNAMEYPVAAWQKTAVTTAWSNAASLILTDIQTIKDLAEANGKVLTRIKINKTWFEHVRNNTQIQKYSATIAQNLLDTQGRPSLQGINAMLANEFQQDIAFEVIDDRITRATTSDVKTTANPFANGVAVFSFTTKVGRFVWKPLPIIEPTLEVYESFFVVGNTKQVNPSMSEIYAKGKGFPVIDSYADNVYLKIDAVAWS